MSLAIETEGTGDAILFIHGLGGSTNVFGPQVATLARSHRCIRFDLPGAGRSPAPLAAATIDEFVRAALSVLDSLGEAGAVHVVAHSMGTVVAQHLAIAAPERVRSLGLLGPIHAPGEAGRKGLGDRATRARHEGLAGIANDIVAAGLSLDTIAHRPEIAAAVREFIMAQTAEGYAQHCEALATAQAANLSRINVPCLLVTGDEDRTAPPLAVRRMQRDWSDSSLALLPGCGHWATLERPREVTALLLDFLLAAS